MEVTERVYVDKPIKMMQSEIPIERKQDIANTLRETNLIAKLNINKNNDPYSNTSFVIGGQ